VIYLVDCPFRIPRFTHHSADLSAFLDSAFYFPHSAIPHFTNTPYPPHVRGMTGQHRLSNLQNAKRETAKG